ncbi:hypothetical protein P4O66_000897 [Electrophorus voltai]|uniref:Reverse transcriptase/retrotransposon-derived protein RNase H-like domain-containing protein n=1 Tax=Electrophorus voltai TaxID=2609070 RepID=A0AAD8ZF56_9TELE|nr:hypothetical protein P4O66_000897 [Electrophorus voltai]
MVDEHITNVRRVFHTCTISFLGFVISHNKLCMDPTKVRAIENWPRPTSVHLVQCLLGFRNFTRKVLTRKASGWFCWSTKAQQVFNELKRHMIKASILQLPDAELPFVIEADASEVGIGAVLSQRSREDDKLHPSAYFSQCLSPSDWNYNCGRLQSTGGQTCARGVEAMAGGGKTHLPDLDGP